MASWQEVHTSAPEFAEAVLARFATGKHKILGTLRRDGAPRLSGIETIFTDGQLWLGMMPNSLKARDLQRDPRLALHSPSLDPPDDPTTWYGDARISGRAIAITDPALIDRFRNAPDQPMHLFKVDIEAVTLVRIGNPADHLVIEVWKPGQPLHHIKRY